MKSWKNVARNLLATGREPSRKEVEEIRKRIEKNDFLSFEKACKIGNCKNITLKDNERLFLNENIIFRIDFTPKMNIKNIIPWCETYESLEKSIPEHNDKIYQTGSDIGSYLINGMLFHNGIGDGENTVIVRTIKNLPEPCHPYYTKAQIYARPYEFRPANGIIKIWEHDCKNPDVDAPMLTVDCVIDVIVHEMKLYIIRYEGDK